MIYGVSSHVSSIKTIRDDYTLYDWMGRQRFIPAFWVRDLTGDTAATRREVAFLRKRDCRIALIVQGIEWGDGRKDALCAVKAARALGVPRKRGIALFAEITNRRYLNSTWIADYVRVVHRKGYVPGFWVNTASNQHVYVEECVRQSVKHKHLQIVYGTHESFSPTGVQLWGGDDHPFSDFGIDNMCVRDRTALKYLW